MLIDVVLGKSFAYMVDHAKGGNNARNNYICNQTNEDILIFGSSRAVHHYNPIILSDSLGMSCYNCGQDGNGAILNYGRYQLITRRYHPRLIIYDYQYTSDMLADEDNHKFLGWLRAYYNCPGIPEIFESVDYIEKYKMCSRMYRYNSNFLNILTDFIHPVKSEGFNGYLPENVSFDKLKVKSDNYTIIEQDSLKIHYLKRIIEESKNSKIIFTISPYWNGIDARLLKTVYKICEEYQLDLIDYSNHPKYLHHDEYFGDGSHLNSFGADEYTNDIVKELKQRHLI